MATTLAQSLQPASIDWKTLHKDYNPLLNLVRELIGLIPNCDTILEIWPPGFRTYNLLVPNMFNLPNTLFGSKSFKAAMGLAMYASSKAACAYCTAHACSFALRRGARADAIAGERTEKELAIVTLAEALAHIPSRLTVSDVDAVRKHFSTSETEWLVYAISMMGFLNKFMHSVGVELEQEAINDTAALLSKTGWKPGLHALNGYEITKSGTPAKDNIFTYLRVIRHAPGAVLWEKKWTSGVPANYPAARKYLEQHTGYSFPILKPVKVGRVVRTLTAALRDNLDRENTITGLKIKMYAGYFFSNLVQNEILRSEIKSLSALTFPEVKGETFNTLAEMAQLGIPTDLTACTAWVNSFQQQFSLTESEAAALLLAVAISYSPS